MNTRPMLHSDRRILSDTLRAMRDSHDTLVTLGLFGTFTEPLSPEQADAAIKVAAAIDSLQTLLATDRQLRNSQENR